MSTGAYKTSMIINQIKEDIKDLNASISMMNAQKSQKSHNRSTSATHG
jgi:hypothetical protein